VICGARQVVELDDETVDVHCSLPAGHAEGHQGAVWWSVEPDCADEHGDACEGVHE
jgi:hypothetical protein